jgi:MoaA/NifB/PqqE/SkfB family radical SAM enzyme
MIPKFYDYKPNRTIHIELTSRCNLTCLKCPRTFRLNEGNFTKQDLDWNVFVNVVNDPQRQRFTLCGNTGDPIYYPKFIEAIKYIKEAGKSFNLNTNGSGRSLDWHKEWAKYTDDRDQITISIDGLEDTSPIYRVGQKPKDSFKLLEYLGKRYHTDNKNSARIKWDFIIFKHNQHQIKEAQKRADDVPVNINFVRSGRWDGPDDPLLPDRRFVSDAYRNYLESLDQNIIVSDSD